MRKQRHDKSVRQGWTLYRGNETVQVLWPSEQGAITNGNRSDVTLQWGSGNVTRGTRATVCYVGDWGWGFVVDNPRLCDLRLGKNLGHWALIDEKALILPAPEAIDVHKDIMVACVNYGATRSAGTTAPGLLEGTTRTDGPSLAGNPNKWKEARRWSRQAAICRRMREGRQGSCRKSTHRSSLCQSNIFGGHGPRLTP